MKKKLPNVPTYSSMIESLNKENKAYELEERDGHQCIVLGGTSWKFKNNLLTEQHRRINDVSRYGEIDTLITIAVEYDEHNRVSRIQKEENSDTNCDGDHIQTSEYKETTFTYHEGGRFSKKIFRSYNEVENGEEIVNGSSLTTYVCDGDGNVIKKIIGEQPNVLNTDRCR